MRDNIADSHPRDSLLGLMINTAHSESLAKQWSCIKLSCVPLLAPAATTGLPDGYRPNQVERDTRPFPFMACGCTNNARLDVTTNRSLCDRGKSLPAVQTYCTCSTTSPRHNMFSSHPALISPSHPLLLTHAHHHEHTHMFIFFKKK